MNLNDEPDNICLSSELLLTQKVSFVRGDRYLDAYIFHPGKANACIVKEVGSSLSPLLAEALRELMQDFCRGVSDEATNIGTDRMLNGDVDVNSGKKYITICFMYCVSNISYSVFFTSF